MSTLTTNNTIERPETTEGLEYGSGARNGFTGPLLKELKDSVSGTARDLETIHGGCSETDECTYETHETYEIDEIGEAEERQEPEEPEEREEVNRLSAELWFRIYEAISECEVSENRNINRPLFMLAHKLRSIEEELNARFSMDVIADILHRWKEQNSDYLETDHDYLAEFLDKLSLVRFPRGRALLRAVEIARGIVPPKQTVRLSSDVQLLASLCGVLQQQAGKKPFFLDGRSAAKALGRPHETVASWLRALCRLGVIKRLSRGRPGMASRYLYVATQDSVQL